MKQSPNILWICTDQQRWDTLGCYGNPFVHTPNIDRLATDGVLFEHAFCQNPVCTPSRASFLTGRYPRTCRARQNGQSIPLEEVLVTRLLAEAGYVCGLSGKLHISACRDQPQGERRINDGYHLFHWSHHPGASNPPSNKWNHLTNEYNLWLRAKGVSYQTSSLSESPFVRVGMPEKDHQTTWCTEKAVHFIEEAQGYAFPWLFSVNIFDPHHPFDPPEEFFRRYAAILNDLPLPNHQQGELENKPVWQHIDHEGAYSGREMASTKMSAKDHRCVRAAYWAMCDLIDVQVGRMLNALERTGQRENTIVVFMSDHGELLGDHGLYLKGPHFYDPCVQVPLIMSWPGHWKTGIRSPGLVELVDLAPTLLAAAGLPRSAGMQGRSLDSLLAGQTETHRNSVYAEYYNSLCNDGTSVPPTYATMVRTDHYKLVRYHGSEYGELYDLLADPREVSNRWADPILATVKSDMLVLLSDRMAETCDPLPVRISGY